MDNFKEVTILHDKILLDRDVTDYRYRNVFIFNF